MQANACTTREVCPACGAHDPEVAFGQPAWAAQVAGVADSRRTRAALMAADPRLGFGRMLRCRGCLTLFTGQVPDEAALTGFYQSYDGNDGYRRKLARRVGFETRRLFLLKFFVRGRRFLDVGCNLGSAVEAARRNGFAATGLEIDAAAVAIARTLFPGNNFLCGGLAALPAGHVFDLVFCKEVLEHVPDPGAFVRDLTRVIVPGGYCS